MRGTGADITTHGIHSLGVSITHGSITDGMTRGTGEDGTIHGTGTVGTTRGTGEDGMTHGIREDTGDGITITTADGMEAGTHTGDTTMALYSTEAATTAVTDGMDRDIRPKELQGLQALPHHRKAGHLQQGKA